MFYIKQQFITIYNLKFAASPNIDFSWDILYNHKFHTFLIINLYHMQIYTWYFNGQSNRWFLSNYTNKTNWKTNIYFSKEPWNKQFLRKPKLVS